MGDQEIRPHVSPLGEIGREGPFFLTEEQLIGLHRRQIELYGGAPEILDAHGLASAWAAPQNAYVYGSARDLFDLATAYAFHLGKDHPFRDGNKRVAAAAAIVFLRVNGISLEADEMELYEQMIALVTDSIDKQGFAAFLRKRSRRMRSSKIRAAIQWVRRRLGVAS